MVSWGEETMFLMQVKWWAGLKRRKAASRTTRTIRLSCCSTLLQNIAVLSLSLSHSQCFSASGCACTYLGAIPRGSASSPHGPPARVIRLCATCSLAAAPLPPICAPCSCISPLTPVTRTCRGFSSATPLLKLGDITICKTQNKNFGTPRCCSLGHKKSLDTFGIVLSSK